MIARWSQGRKGNGADLKDFRDETLWIMMVVLKSM
jgi:hypothetical protein